MAHILVEYEGRSVCMSGRVSHFKLELFMDSVGSSGYGAFYHSVLSAAL